MINGSIILLPFSILILNEQKDNGKEKGEKMSDTISLLEEVDSGCKMAIDSMNRIGSYGMDGKLSHVIDHYKYKHMELQKQADGMLRQNGAAGKEPGVMAVAMARMTTGVKMFVKDDNNQVAKIMMDGCNMGIQSIAESINKYKQASKESVGLAKSLIKAEEDFMCDLKQFL